MKDCKGKIISILGDSISTFKDCIPTADGINLEHRTRYPQVDLLTDISRTWWMQVISAVNATLGVNDSWAGSCICNIIEGNFKDAGEDAAMASLTRIKNLGANGTPDFIFFYGGTNDAGKNIPLGSFDKENAPAVPNLTMVRWEDFSAAFCEALLRLKYFYPDAELIVMTPAFSEVYYPQERLDIFADRMIEITTHYNITCIDIRKSGISTSMLPDGLHPNGEGMDCIARAALDLIRNPAFCR